MTDLTLDGATVMLGDCIERMKEIPKKSVQTCVTSPPYFGLRDYGVDGQIGLEQTPEQYIAAMVEVFRAVRDVLADDGTLWVNIGDSYAGGNSAGKWREGSARADGNVRGDGATSRRNRNGNGSVEGCKPKDLIGIPWALAKALRDPYYSGKIKREADRVWLAAMMDGEGTISGFYHDRADGTGVRTGVNVCLTNTCTQIINRAAEIWPASLHPHHMNNSRLGTRDVFRWKPNGAENVGDFLAELYPYLMTKKRQAMLAWNLMQFSKDGRKWGKSEHAEDVRQKRAVLVRMISALNSGKPVDIPDWCIEPPSLFEPGYYLRQDIIWSKPNPMPESVRDRCTKAHEYIFLLSKGPRYFFDHEAIKEPAVSSGPENSFARKAGHGKTPGKPMQHREDRPDVEYSGTRNRRSVWTVATRPYKGAHFATFPPALIEPCILAGSRPGDIVLDPFNGSGTTGQVSIENGRKYIGIELNPEYLGLTSQRLGSAIENRDAKILASKPAPQMNLFGDAT